MTERKLQFIEGSSSKFWHAKIEGLDLIVAFGRIGTLGQSQTKSFATSDAAQKAFDKLVAEKRKKGYVDEPGASTTPSVAGSASRPEPKPAAPAAAPASERATSAPSSSGDAESDASTDDAEATVMVRSAAPAASVAAPTARPVARIGVTDRDRARALVGGVAAPLPRPPTEPFDREATIAKLARLGTRDAWVSSLPWSRLDLSIAMSREEARIHFYAMRGASTQLGGVLDGIASMSVINPTPDLSRLYCMARPLALVVYRAFGIATTITLLTPSTTWVYEPWFDGFESDVVPFLDLDERREFRDAFRAQLVSAPDSRTAVRLLGALGEDVDTIRSWISGWPAGSGKRVPAEGGYGGNSVLRALFALGDPDLIASEGARLEANPTTADEVRLLLAATGTRALDLVVAAILSASAKGIAESLTKALALVEAPEAALPMLRVMMESRAPGVARAWLDEHPVFAAEALAPLVGSAGAKGEVATAYFRTLVNRGLAEVVEGALAGMPEAQANSVRARVAESIVVEHPVAADDELPEWAARCFGDPAKLTAPAVELAPAMRDPVVRVDLEGIETAVVAPRLPDPEPLATPARFDFEACLARMLAGTSSSTYGQTTHHVWHHYDLRPVLPMSREEAHFWHVAVPLAEPRCSAAEFEAKVRAMRFDGRVAAPRERVVPRFVAVQYVLFGYEGIAHCVASWHDARAVVGDAISQVVRFLGTGERDALRAFLLARSEPTLGGLLLAKRLGATRAELVPKLRALVVTNVYQAAEKLELLSVIEDPAEIVRIAEKLSTAPNDATSAARWLALTGTLGVPVLSRAVQSAYGDKGTVAKVLGRVASPEIAPMMLALRKSSATKEIARQWLEANPVFAIDGLLPLARSKDKQSAAAVDYLRDLRRRGFGALIAERSEGDATVAKVILDPRAGLSKPTRADEALVATLPQLTIRCDSRLRRLAPAHVATVLAELRSSSLGAPTPPLVLLRENADRHALDAFVWALFQGWMNDGAPTKERWKLEAVGHLGGDASALRLATLVRAWPGESQHQRAVLGLDCLRAIGTDTALMQIHAISQRVSFKGIKERAGECLDGIAQDRGLTRDELADRIIPDGGLDSRGSCVFDFGPRTFTFQLGPDLKPAVRDASGRRLPDLPKPGAKDDAALASDAVASWRLLKKVVADVAKTQAGRLESAMVVGRRWTIDEFDTLLRRHPLMVHLVRRLVWSAYDAADRPVQSFRLADDDTLADADDVECALPSTATSIGVTHSSQLTEGERGLWGERLADYDIVAPFQQLGRPTLGLRDDEVNASMVQRFGGHDVDAKVLVFGLEALGWQRGRPEDAGGFGAHHKTYGRVTAVVTYREGCWVGTNGDDWPRQRIEAVGFVREAREAESGFFWFRDASTIPLSEVAPIVLSEAIYDVTRLYERGAPQP